MLEFRFGKQLPPIKDVDSNVELAEPLVAQEVAHGKVLAEAPVAALRRRWIP